jgi:hypothetical protein
MISNLTQFDHEDEERQTSLIAAIALQLQNLYDISIPPELIMQLGKAQAVQLIPNSYAIIHDLTPYTTRQSTYVIKINKQTKLTSTSQTQFKNTYIISLTNHMDLHNIHITAAIRGLTVEDAPFTSKQILKALRDTLEEIPEHLLDCIIQPVYTSFTMLGQTQANYTLFYTLITYSGDRYLLDDIKNTCMISPTKPTFIIINNQRTFQMADSTTNLTKMAMPNSVLATQKAIHIKGLNRTATVQNIYDCTPSIKDYIDTIQLVSPDEAYILLTPLAPQIQSFPNTSLLQHKLPKKTLLIQPIHLGRTTGNSSFNPFECSNSTETPNRITSSLPNSWIPVEKKRPIAPNGKTNRK